MRLLLIFLVLLITVAVYQGTEKSGGNTKAGNAQNHSQRKIDPLPPVSNVTNITNREEDRPAEQERGTGSNLNGFWKHWDSYINAVSTAVIAFLTLLTLLVYRAILKASKINERAWIVPIVGVITPTDDPKIFQIQVQLTNNGKTPAWVTAAGSSGKGVTRSQPLPATPNYSEMGPFSGKGSLLSPGASLPQGLQLEKERLEHVQAGRSQLYIFGYAKYRDAYGDKHIVRYCFEAQKSQDLNHPYPLEFYIGGPDNYIAAN